MQPRTERVSFANRAGHRISARLERPNRPVASAAIFAHCFTCSKEFKAVNWISRRLAERGLAVLRFDFAGLGESTGEFAETNFSTNLDDLVTVADYLRSRGLAPAILIGHSLGGTASLVAAARIPECGLVATIAAPADTMHIYNHLAEEHPEILEKGEGQVNFGGRIVRIRRHFLEDLAAHDVPAAVAGLGRPLMVFHSPQDRVVRFEHAVRLFEAAQPPKSLISLEGADHLLLNDEADAHYVADCIATWADRYLAHVAVEATAPGIDCSVSQVTVEGVVRTLPRT